MVTLKSPKNVFYDILLNLVFFQNCYQKMISCYTAFHATVDTKNNQLAKGQLL